VKGDSELWCRLVWINADFTIGFRFRDGQVCFSERPGDLRAPLSLLDSDLGIFSMDLDSESHTGLPSCEIYDSF
jgi:hypothetical protein